MSGGGKDMNDQDMVKKMLSNNATSKEIGDAFKSTQKLLFMNKVICSIFHDLIELGNYSIDNTHFLNAVFEITTGRYFNIFSSPLL